MGPLPPASLWRSTWENLYPTKTKPVGETGGGLWTDPSFFVGITFMTTVTRSKESGLHGSSLTLSLDPGSSKVLTPPPHSGPPPSGSTLVVSVICALQPCPLALQGQLYLCCLWFSGHLQGKKPAPPPPGVLGGYSDISRETFVPLALTLWCPPWVLVLGQKGGHGDLPGHRNREGEVGDG